MATSKNAMDYRGDGDHLPKTSTSKTIGRITEILKNNPNPVFYDRPEDGGQSLLAHRTLWSEVAAKKYGGKPSRERHSGD